MHVMKVHQFIVSGEVYGNQIHTSDTGIFRFESNRGLIILNFESNRIAFAVLKLTICHHFQRLVVRNGENFGDL